MNADIMGADYNMYDAPFPFGMGGWFIFILFIVYQIMLWRKTESLQLLVTTSLIFIATKVAINFMMAPYTFALTITIAVFYVGLLFTVWILNEK